MPRIPVPSRPRFLRFFVAELNIVLFALGVSRYLRRNKADIDVIHLHLTSMGLLVSTLNRSLRDKMVYTCHLSQWAYPVEGWTPFQKAHLKLDSCLMKRVRKIIALNAVARERFISFGKVDAQKIVVQPNGVDTSYFSPGAQDPAIARRYQLDGRVSVLFAGRIARIKGVDHLLKAANIVVNRFGRRATLFILAGPEVFTAVDEAMSRKVIDQFLSTHGLQMNVILPGSLTLEELRALYAACDIFVLPSLAEADPLAILEAISSGKPVIGTRVGGIPDKIREGWNGFLVDPGNEQQLADRINYLLENAGERQRMGLNSRTLAEEEFDWSRVVEKLVMIYGN
ncbi:MAG: glycosyltransferase family 4 protein [Dehalococcoidia bacterium]|nr:glycosyltransferase family 4 protein [Dehalococcoidia bacterium]